MGQVMENAIVKRFRESVRKQAIPKGLKLRIEIAGGMPSERIEEEFSLSENGFAESSYRDSLIEGHSRSGEAKLDGPEQLSLLQQIDESLARMVTREEARFPPDTTVGRLSIGLEGEEVTLFFAVDEESLTALAANGTPDPMAKVIAQFRRIADTRGGEAGE